MTFNKSRQSHRSMSGAIAEPARSSLFSQAENASSNVARKGFFQSGTALALVSAAGLLAATLVTACSQFTQTLTVDFVYVASSRAAGSDQYGQIDVFEINSESGNMRTIPSSPFPSGGRNPVAEVVSTDYNNLFVANHDDNTIVQFSIGSDGKLYPYATVNTPGIYPLALAMTKSNLFVADTYQPLAICSNADPCSGALIAFPLNAATSTNPITIGSAAFNSGVGASYWPLNLSGSSDIVTPTAVNALPSGSFVYATAYDSTNPSGYVFAYSVGTGGVLTAVPGSPFAVGTQPSAVASDSTGTHLYVTDIKNGVVLGYSIASNGVLTPLTSGTGGTNKFPAGNSPSAIVIDQSFPFAYVANSVDSTVNAYTMSNGALTRVATYSTGSQPIAMGIDPSTAHFLYTVNFLGSSMNGWQLSETAGTLLISQNSPYATDANPTAVAAIPHNGTGGGIH